MNVSAFVTDVVAFDNSFSWARWKHLHYSVSLLLCDRETEQELNQRIKKGKKILLQPKTTDHLNLSQISVNVASIVRIESGRKCTSLKRIEGAGGGGDHFNIKTTRMHGGVSQKCLVADDKPSLAKNKKSFIESVKCACCF